MPNRDSHAKIARLKIRQDQIQAQIINTENRLKRTKSKIETRKKILVGSYFRRKFANDGEWEKLVRLINPYLIRPYERALFGLPEIPEHEINPSRLSSDFDLPLKGTILIGAFFMEQYKNDQNGLLKLIDPFLHRPIDRKLFGLDQRNSEKEALPF